jgi:hypothetical protein
MVNKLKSTILTYLFKDWIDKETDVEILNITARAIKRKVNLIEENIDTGRTIIKGFNAK